MNNNDPITKADLQALKDFIRRENEKRRAKYEKRWRKCQKRRACSEDRYENR